MFTIIIPTRNRAETLQHCLQTCVEQQRDDLCILVSDNMSVDNTREVIRDFEQRDSRVKYMSPGENLSMARHFQFALEHCKEGFVGAIGDDDGFIPGGLDDAARLVEEYPNAQGIAWRQSDYIYANSPFCSDLGWPPNLLCVPLDTGSELRHSTSVLHKVLDAQVEYFNLPGTYHSFIHTRVLNEVRQQSRGPTWINEPAPDIYLFVATGFKNLPFAYSKRSISIRGASKSSTGAAYSMPSGDQRAAQEHLAAEFPKMHPDWDCPLRPILTIVHSCLARAIEAGLPHDSYAVNWKNVLTRILLDIKTSPTRPEFPSAMAFAKGIAQRVNQVSWHQEICDLTLDELRKLVVTDPEPSAREHFHFESVPAVSNIHDACRFAGLVYTAPEVVPFMQSSLQRINDLKLTIDKHALLKEKNGELRARNEDLKQQLTKTKQRHQDLKQKLAGSRIYRGLEKLGIIR